MWLVIPDFYACRSPLHRNGGQDEHTQYLQPALQITVNHALFANYINFSKNTEVYQ